MLSDENDNRMLAVIVSKDGNMHAGESVNQYYNGSESYRYIEPLLRNGRDICIVSPYIDRYYAGFMKSISRGKRIRIISSSIDRDAQAILKKRPRRGLLLATVAALFLANYLLYSAAYPRLVVLLSLSLSAAILLLLAFGSLSEGSAGGDIKLRIPRGFVHAKIYISENAAVAGSANLTYRGMHKNIEQIGIIHEAAEIKRLRDEFMRMWDSC